MLQLAGCGGIYSCPRPKGLTAGVLLSIESPQVRPPGLGPDTTLLITDIEGSTVSLLRMRSTWQGVHMYTASVRVAIQITPVGMLGSHAVVHAFGWWRAWAKHNVPHGIE